MSSEMYEPAIFMSEQVTYGDFYAWFKAKLVAAGWENITSNYATDGDVWHSTGESGTKNYYFKTVAPSLVSTELWGGGMIARPYLKYTPGSLGSSGVFVGDGGITISVYVSNFKLAFPVTLTAQSTYCPPLTAEYTVYTSINRDRVIVTLTLPEGYFTGANYSGLLGRSNLWYVGAPELYSTSGQDSESSKGLIVHGTTLNQNGPNYAYQGVNIYSSVGSNPVLANYDANPIYKLGDSPIFRLKNMASKYPLMDLICGGPYEGTILKLKDIFVLSEVGMGAFTDVFEGDLITDGEYMYKVIAIQLPTNRTIPLMWTNKYAIRVS